MPVEHYYGWLSEHFGGALPSVIAAEMARLPFGFLEQLVEYRAYANAKHANEVEPNGWDSSPMRTLAQEIEMQLVTDEVIGNG